MKQFYAKYIPKKELLRHELRNARIIAADGRLGKVGNFGEDIGIIPILFDDGTNDKDGKYEWDVTDLWLCSRNIKTGDVVTYRGLIGYASSPTQPNGIHDFYDEDNGLHHIYKEDFSELYKPLGRISNEAGWVRDGDEFDEEDLSIRFTNMHGTLTNGSDDIFTEENVKKWNEDYMRFGVKGPCNHFH